MIINKILKLKGSVTFDKIKKHLTYLWQLSNEKPVVVGVGARAVAADILP